MSGLVPTKKLMLAVLTAILVMMGLAMSFRFTRIHILARLGHAESMYALGSAWSSLSGEGLTRGRMNWERATYWYEKAAEKGSGEADFSLYQMWRVLGKPEDIRRRLLRGARNGDQHCMHALANAYRFGLHGFEKDLSKSEYWFQKIPAWRP